MASDNEPRLSETAMQALQEFLQEQMLQQQQEEASSVSNTTEVKFQEDWQLSQFWYDEQTAHVLAKEALTATKENSQRIACISCPTLYSAIVKIKTDSCQVKLLEYDRRFSCYGNDFIFYDYCNPLNLSDLEKHSFNVVVADPPFLSEECLTKTSVTIKYLTKEKIILCTGAVMEELAQKLLGVKACTFKPNHVRQLANEFKCFVNYESDL